MYWNTLLFINKYIFNPTCNKKGHLYEIFTALSGLKVEKLLVCAVAVLFCHH